MPSLLAFTKDLEAHIPLVDYAKAMIFRISHGATIVCAKLLRLVRWRDAVNIEGFSYLQQYKVLALA